MWFSDTGVNLHFSLQSRAHNFSSLYVIFKQELPHMWLLQMHYSGHPLPNKSWRKWKALDCMYYSKSHWVTWIVSVEVSSIWWEQLLSIITIWVEAELTIFNHTTNLLAWWPFFFHCIRKYFRKRHTYWLRKQISWDKVFQSAWRFWPEIQYFYRRGWRG